MSLQKLIEKIKNQTASDSNLHGPTQINSSADDILKLCEAAERMKEDLSWYATKDLENPNVYTTAKIYLRAEVTLKELDQICKE